MQLLIKVKHEDYQTALDRGLPEREARALARGERYFRVGVKLEKGDTLFRYITKIGNEINATALKSGSDVNDLAADMNEMEIISALAAPLPDNFDFSPFDGKYDSMDRMFMRQAK